MKGVIWIKDNGCIKIYEKKLDYSPETYQIQIRFCIDKSAPSSKMTLLQGNTIPLNISFEPTTVKDKYQISAYMFVNGKNRSTQSIKELTIKKDCWYILNFVLLDGQFHITISDIADKTGKQLKYCRRVFANVPNLLSSNDKYMYIGKSPASNDNGFIGYIDEILFSDIVDEEQQEIATKLANEGFMEIESKYEDLSFDNIKLGNLVSSKNYIDKSAANCYYNVYKNGIIFWSMEFKCIYMTEKMFSKYRSLLNTSMIGLPIEDEIAVASKGSYCLFEFGGLFYSNKLANFVFISSEIVTEWARNGYATEDGFGFPISQISTKSLKDKDNKIEYVRFERCTIFNIMSAIYDSENKKIVNWQTNVISLTNDIANKYLDKCDEIGFFESFYNGYVDTKNKIKFQYIQMQNKTIVLKYKDNILDSSFFYRK